MSGIPASGPGCPGSDPRLAALLDGELPPDEQRLLEEHLLSCPRCASDLAQQREVQAMLRRTASALLPPPALLEQVQARLGRVEQRSSRRPWTLVFGSLAAALALVASIALIGRFHREPSAAMFERAAVAHQQETLGPAPLGYASADPAAVAGWARRQTGRSVDVPAFDGLGYHLLGIRLDQDVAPDAVTLVYQGAGTSITCTIVPREEPLWMRLPLAGAAGDVRATTIGGVGVAGWEDNDAAYIMAADLSPSLLLHLAQFVRQTAS